VKTRSHTQAETLVIGYILMLRCSSCRIGCVWCS